MSLRRVSVTLGVFGLIGLSVVGCSRYMKEQRAEWRSQAESACLRAGSVKETQFVKIAKALEGPGSCGADHPIKVTAFTNDNLNITASAPGFFSTGRSSMITKLNQEGTLTCPMYTAVDRWLEQVVQPSAMARFGQPVIELRIMGTYSCRRMNNGSTSARMSEHAYANAIDVGGFRLQDGSIISVLKGWNGGLEEQNFLREVHGGACSHFATVLGPGVAFHHDHLHMDLARHGRRGDRSICRPYPQPVTPANQGFPIDPAKNMPMVDGRSRMPGSTQGDVYAYATPRPQMPSGSSGLLPPGTINQATLPSYRPAQLPPAPRNPVAEREEADLRQAAPRSYQPAQNAPGRRVGEPVILYGQGQGPFKPLPEAEIDPEDLDPVTGSIGE